MNVLVKGGEKDLMEHKECENATKTESQIDTGRYKGWKQYFDREENSETKEEDEEELREER
jgi:hypothetical protein